MTYTFTKASLAKFLHFYSDIVIGYFFTTLDGRGKGIPCKDGPHLVVPIITEGGQKRAAVTVRQPEMYIATKCVVYAYTEFKMAAGDNSGRPPCLNFSGPGPLGNSQPSNSVFSMPASNGGAVGVAGGAQAATRRPNPQLGPGGPDSNGVSTGAQPTAQNPLQQSAAAGAAAAGAMATPATNMVNTAASNASQAAAPTATPAAASVLVYREPVYNWQATKSTVKERFAFLFNNEVLSDVHFLVGKGMGLQRIPAHR